MRVLNIAEGTSVDGPGLRTSIYFAGCTHHCPGCHNPQSWDPEGGRDWTEDEMLDIIRFNDFPVTFSGGDPLYQPQALLSLARRIKEELGKNIWCYTGYKWEQIVNNPQFRPLLDYIDVLVDGPFLLEQRDISLLFRGSPNQRLIHVQPSLQQGTVVEWQ